MQDLAPDKTVPERRAAAFAVGKIGEAATGALRHLLTSLQDPDDRLREAAAFSIGEICGEAGGTPELVAALRERVKNDKEILVRRSAAFALATIGGKESAPAIPVLLDALTNGNIYLKRQAALAFNRLGPVAAEAVSELRKALKSPDKDLRLNAVMGFIGFLATTEPAVPDLLAMLADKEENPNIRAQAAVAISRICRENLLPPLRDGMPTVLRIIGDRREAPFVRERAMWPIRVYLIKSEDRDPVFKALLPILDEPRTKDNKMLRYDIAYILGVFQVAATPERALDVLLEFLKDPEIKIYAGLSRKGTQAEERGADDGPIMAVDALSRVGVKRLARRPDIVAQLRALHNDPRTLANLKKGLDKLVPQLK